MKKAKAKTGTGKVKAKMPGAYATTASPDDRDLGTLIKNLDVASLHNDDVNSILLHCASALNLRKVIDTPGITMAHSSASYCYTKAGNDTTVSIWSGGFKVGESSEADAKASGIPPCG